MKIGCSGRESENQNNMNLDRKMKGSLVSVGGGIIIGLVYCKSRALHNDENTAVGYITNAAVR